MTKPALIEAASLLLKKRMSPTIAVTLLSCEQSPQRISDISIACNLKMCSASKAVTTLKENGLLSKTQGIYGEELQGHGIDRRNSVAHITPEGIKRIKELGLE